MSSSKWLLRETRVPVFFAWSPERKSRISSVLVTGSLLVGDQAKANQDYAERETERERGTTRSPNMSFLMQLSKVVFVIEPTGGWANRIFIQWYPGVQPDLK